jgi:hypothetical protein
MKSYDVLCCNVPLRHSTLRSENAGVTAFF